MPIKIKIKLHFLIILHLLKKKKNKCGNANNSILFY